MILIREIHSAKKIGFHTHHSAFRTTHTDLRSSLQFINDTWRSCETTIATASLFCIMNRAADWWRIPPKSSSGDWTASWEPGDGWNLHIGTSKLALNWIFAPKPSSRISRVMTTAPSTWASDAIARIAPFCPSLLPCENVLILDFLNRPTY